MGKGLPKELSRGEEAFWLHCRARIPNDLPEREILFSSRGWRFDFAWRDRMLAVEVDGGTKRGRSRHSQGAGYEGDCRKLNHAAELGWRVFRFTTAMVESGEAIAEVESLLARLQACPAGIP